MPRARRSRDADGTSPNPPKRPRRYNLRSTSSRAKRDKALGGEQDGRRHILSDEEFRERNNALKVESMGTALKVSSVDHLVTENRHAHHTDEYEQEELIVRRGQQFSLKVTFDRAVDVETDIVVLQFSFGVRPQESKGTVIYVPVSLDDASPVATDNWSGKVIEVKGNCVTVGVTTEPDSNIGKYELYVQTKLKGSDKDFTRHEDDKRLYLLFNPWCADDVVYMESDSEKNEYVLNDTGRIWIGSARSNYGRPWNFGQFESPVLAVALGLLDKGELVDVARTSAVSVIRCISSLANSMDNEGVLEGRWTSEYPKGCTKPSEWTGSVAIIEQYHETGRPVEYGQCWVFSGIVTTLLRALGIPTRSVTNFESAHDSDCSMTIDSHYDEEGSPVDDLDDSVWNFHVWNESWLRRVDLPDGYDGWQVHDATPQEVSEGVMRCGPAPLRAIKEGHVYLNFDTGFIFSEVNGDRIEWEVKEDGKMEVCHIDAYSVGRNISTKAVGLPMRHDLTWDYKYREGSEEERRVVKFVNRFSTRRKENIYRLSQEKQVKFDIVVPDDKFVGDDLEVGVKVTNVSAEDRSVKVRLTLASTFYTGVVGKRIKGETTELSIAAGDEKPVMMSVTADEYKDLMNPEADFKLTGTCRVVETNRLFATKESFFLKKPGLTFDIPEKVCSSVETTATITFKNTTNFKLHNGIFHVEGSYMVKARVYTIRKVIHPGDEVSIDVDVLPRRLGERMIMATFSTEEITDVEGEVTVTVVAKADWDAEMEGEEAMETEAPVLNGGGDGGATEEDEADGGVDETATVENGAREGADSGGMEEDGGMDEVRADGGAETGERGDGDGAMADSGTTETTEATAGGDNTADEADGGGDEN